MTIDRRLLAGALGLSLALAACGGASTASPAATAGSGDATAVPTAEPAETEAAETESPVETEQATDDYTGGVPGGLTELAALLPAAAGDVTFQRAGFDGGQLGLFGAAAGLSEDELGPVLEKFGKTLADVNFAIAAPDSASGSTAMIYAVQIEGVDAAEAMGAMGMDPSAMNKTTVGGKEVYAQGGGGFGIWAYPKDDVLFAILLASDEVAEAVLQQLP